jgi:hypothetical protein
LPATENSPLFEIGRLLARRSLIDNFEVMVFHDLRRIAHLERDLSLFFWFAPCDSSRMSDAERSAYELRPFRETDWPDPKGMSAFERGSTTTLIARAFVARAHGRGKRQPTKTVGRNCARWSWFPVFRFQRAITQLNDHTSDQKTVIVKT